jgi:hypothetical protein
LVTPLMCGLYRSAIIPIRILVFYSGFMKIIR